MQAAIDQFRWNLQRVRNFGSLYQILSTQTTSALDLSDLLRAELVMVVSALDLYVHELVRLGMLESLRGQRPQTSQFHDFQVTLGATIQGISTPGSDVWLDDQIRARNNRRTFQNPGDISSAIQLVSNMDLWDSVATHLNLPRQDVTAQLRVIVDRRNKIVHEADSDPSYGQIGNLWPLSFTLTDDAVTFVEQVVEAVHAVVV